MIQNKSQLSSACQAVMAKYAPAVSPVQTVAAATDPLQACVDEAGQDRRPTPQRPGKPLNILMRLVLLVRGARQCCCGVAFDFNPLPGRLDLSPRQRHMMPVTDAS
jgi:hypothetical protein